MKELDANRIERMARERRKYTPRKGSRFEKLIAWQRAYQLTIEVYAATSEFPTQEKFALTSQMRRASVSISSNIAEGWGRGSTSDYLRFLDMARGSAYELQTQLWLAADLNFMGEDDPCHELITEVERLINGLIRSFTQQIRRVMP